MKSICYGFQQQQKKKKKIASKALRVCSIKQEGQAPMKYYDLHRGTCWETPGAWNQLYIGPSKWTLKM
jgi:hypothetical protein